MKYFFMSYSISIFISSIFMSCAISESQQVELDIVSSKDKTAEEVLNHRDSSIDSANVIQWKKHFLPQPSARQRHNLENQLATQPKPSKIPDILKRARVNMAIGLNAEAEALLKEVVRRDRFNQEAKVDLAFLFIRRGNVHSAFETLAQLREEFEKQENPDRTLQFRYRYALALCHLANKDRLKARAVLSELIGLDPTFSPGYVALASSYMEQGSDHVAEFVLQRGLDRGKEDASLLNMLGVIFERKGKRFDARKTYDKAIQISPTFVPAIINRALLAMKDLEYTLAEEDLKSALAIDPMNVDGYIALARVQRRTGRFPAAKRSLETAISLNPDNAIARFNLGLLLAEDLKKPDDALRFMAEVVQLSGDNKELKDLATGYLAELKSAKY